MTRPRRLPRIPLRALKAILLGEIVTLDVVDDIRKVLVLEPVVGRRVQVDRSKECRHGKRVDVLGLRSVRLIDEHLVGFVGVQRHREHLAPRLVVGVVSGAGFNFDHGDRTLREARTTDVVVGVDGAIQARVASVAERRVGEVIHHKTLLVAIQAVGVFDIHRRRLLFEERKRRVVLEVGNSLLELSNIPHRVAAVVYRLDHHARRIRTHGVGHDREVVEVHGEVRGLGELRIETRDTLYVHKVSSIVENDLVLAGEVVRVVCRDLLTSLDRRGVARTRACEAQTIVGDSRAKVDTISKVIGLKARNVGVDDVAGVRIHREVIPARMLEVFELDFDGTRRRIEGILQDELGETVIAFRLTR